jgi:hypothetical protein
MDLFLVKLLRYLLLIFLLILFAACSEENGVDPTNPADMPYEVVIDPDDFENVNITGNNYFNLTPGRTFVYLGENEKGDRVDVEETITDQTKVIMGVTCRVVRAVEWEKSEMIEDTFDWYAQDKEGNVWYFGEDSRDIENGEIVGTAGSWEAGVDGALPGILLLANPIAGMWYRQEYYKSEAEDVAQVLSLAESITVPFGTYNNCLKTAEWNLLEKGIIEHKIYAPGVGLLRAVAVKGESGYEDLVEIRVD